MTTETSSGDCIDYETHVELIAENAATEHRLKLAQKLIQSLEIDAEELRDELCETVASLAEAMSACHRKDSMRLHQTETIESLTKELTEKNTVIAELNASRDRLIEQRDAAERRLMQATKGELDEELAGLRELLVRDRNTIIQRDQQLKEACAKVEVQRDRAQKAEAELSGLRNKMQRVLAELNGLKEANGEMSRVMAKDGERIADLTVELDAAKRCIAACESQMDMDAKSIAALEKSIDGLRAELSHSTMEAPDAVA